MSATRSSPADARAIRDALIEQLDYLRTALAAADDAALVNEAGNMAWLERNLAAMRERVNGGAG